MDLIWSQLYHEAQSTMQANSGIVPFLYVTIYMMNPFFVSVTIFKLKKPSRFVRRV